MKTIQRNSKEIEIMILLSYLFIFLVNFWVYHFFQNFDVFSWFRKLPMDPKWCFFMPWWSRDHPRLILDGFGKLHFSWKFSFFDRNFEALLSWKLTCTLKPWSIWVYPDLKWSNTRNYFKSHQILPSRCWEKQKTKLKRDLNQEPKISRKFSIRGNYSWAYLL